MLNKKICRFAILGITLLHLAQIFTALNLSPAVFFFAALLLVFGISKLGAGFRKITLLFLGIGCAILVYYEQPLMIWIEALISMTNLTAIIVVMQLFSMPIEAGEYSNTVEYWLKRSFKKESSLYLFAMLTTHMFSSFLLFGTAPVMVSLFSNALKNNISSYQRFLATSIVRGYALVLFWAPGAVIMLLILEVTGVSWFDLFIPGLLLSLLGLITSYLLEHCTRLNKPIKTVTNEITDKGAAKQATKQSFHIILVVLGLLILTAFFDAVNVGGKTGKILLAGLIVACLWSGYYLRQAQFSSVIHRYWAEGITKATDLSVFFIAMGLFAFAVDKSGVLTHLQPTLQNGVNQLGLFSVVVVPLLFILLSLFGIHPFIIAVIAGKILTAIALPLPMTAIALLLVLSSAISFILSPFAGMVMLTAKFLNVKPMEVGLKWNVVFCIIFLAEGIILACLWR